jgi:hypothetical protein
MFMKKARRTIAAIWFRRLLPAILLAVAASTLSSPAQTNDTRLENVHKTGSSPAGTNAGSILDARIATFRQMLPLYATSQRDEAENRLTFATVDHTLIDTYGGLMSCSIVAFVYSNDISPRTICLHLTSQAKADRFRSDHGVTIRRDDLFFSPSILKYDRKLVAGAGTVEQIFPELTPDQLRDLAFARSVFIQVGTNAYEIPADQRQSWRVLWTYFALNRARLANQTGHPGPLPPMTWEETYFQTTTLARERQRNTVLNRALQSNQEAAAQGDSYGLLRLGERYRDGEGVAMDLKKAREYLQKAAAAGSPTAADELSALPSP